jgi:hypothetical protein
VSAAITVMLGAPAAADGGIAQGLIAGGMAGCIVAVLLTVLLLFHAWLDKPAGGQAPQGLPPGTGGEASHGVTPTGPAGQLPPMSGNPQHTAEATPNRLPRTPLPGARPSRRRHSLLRGYAIGCPGH